MEVRDATEADLPQLLAIYNQAIRETTASWDLTEWDELTHRQWYDAKLAAADPVLVADEAGEILGFAAWGPFRAKAGYAATREHSVYVRTDAHRRGIGRALLEAIIARALQAGIHVLIGGLSADNHASLALHERLGFVEAGRLPQVGHKFGEWLDLVLVQRTLPAAGGGTDER